MVARFGTVRYDDICRGLGQAVRRDALAAMYTSLWSRQTTLILFVVKLNHQAFCRVLIAIARRAIVISGPKYRTVLAKPDDRNPSPSSKYSRRLNPPLGGHSERRAFWF